MSDIEQENTSSKNFPVVKHKRLSSFLSFYNKYDQIITIIACIVLFFMVGLWSLIIIIPFLLIDGIVIYFRYKKS